MKFDKETIIILVGCLLLMLAWPSIGRLLGFSSDKKPAAAEVQNAGEPGKSSTTAGENTAAGEKASPAAATIAPPVKNTESKPQREPVELKNDNVILTVSGDTGAITAVEFDKFDKNDRASGKIRVAALAGSENETAIGSYFIPGDEKVVTESVESRKNDDGTAVTTIRTLKTLRGSFQLIQTVALKDNYIINSTYTFKNTGKEAVTIPASIISGGAMEAWHELSGDKIRSKAYTVDYMTSGGDFEQIDADEDDEDFVAPGGEVKWAGVANKYFSLLMKKSSADSKMWMWRTNINGDEKKPLVAAGIEVPGFTLAPGESKDIACEIYAGPKKKDLLAAFAPGADESLHMAWGPINYLARFMMWVLNLLYSLCGSYGVSIILLTLMVRTIFYPITARGNESMKKMQTVQPKLKALREKYKDNPQLLNQKMTELYRQEGVNPFAGCLPILLQIPIFFALYAMLDNVIALRHESFLWCKNLAAADTVCSIPLPFIGTSLPLNPLVLVMTALMVVQQRMTPSSADPMQKKMMMFMPLIMLLFLYDLPSGLTLYWTVSNIFSIVQLRLQQKRSQAQTADAGAGK